MTEKEKMLQGLLYDPTDPELVALRQRAHKLCRLYNQTDESQTEEVNGLLRELIPNLGEGSFVCGPLFLDYGVFTTIGKNSWINVNLTVLDTCPVKIGEQVFMGPNCSILTPLHPLLPEERNLRRRPDGSYYDLEYGKPITIEDDCWICGDVKILGGVTIGRGSVIGAGSVVTRDIPAGVLAAGNPCRVLRPLTDADRMGIPEESVDGKTVSPEIMD